MKKLIFVLIICILLLVNITAYGTIFYLDYELGDDVNDGSDWANAWKTLTNGATNVRIAPGDVIRIAKSPAPTSIGDATWTNLSKTVTLAGAQTTNIDMCETAWTANGAGDATVTRTAVASDGKEGSYSMKIALDSAVQASIMQAYYATGELDLSSYQKISFWIKNSGVISTDDWIVNLCSDVAGANVVDSFLIPAIPSTYKWVPLTLTKEGGGNLGASIKSIAIYSGSGVPLASKYILVDNFIACTTNGLNLQSLISKNPLEQGGSEGWYGIQSINDVTVLLDNDTNTKGNAGRGYSTSGTTPDTVESYKRETIKTVMVSGSTNAIQSITDSGNVASGDIEFQGVYNISTTIQEGETFFDGLSSQNYGLFSQTKKFITLNYLNFYRYYSGFYLYTGTKHSIINMACGNNYQYGLYFNASCKNIIMTKLHMSNNTKYGIYHQSCDNTIAYTVNASNNLAHGIYFASGSNNHKIVSLFASNNVGYGIYYTASYDNSIRSLYTVGNTVAGIYFVTGNVLYLSHASINEGTEIAGLGAFGNIYVYSNNHDRGANHRIFTDGGQIDSEATDREGGTGIMWKLAITHANRDFYYPLKLSVAKIAVVADKLVTVNIYMKKSHATNVVGKLVCPGGQLDGMSVADITDTKADDADTWEELEITFTPTEMGVVEIEAWAYYIAGNADVYIEDMTIVQAE